MCDMYDPSNIKPDYYIDHYIEGPIAYTEDHVPVKRLRFFKVCPQMAENTLKAFFERFGNILEWRLAKDPKNMCEHCLGSGVIYSSVEEAEKSLLNYIVSLEGRDLKNTLQHKCLSGEVLYANAEDAASVLLCYPHCEEGKYFKVEPSYTWKQPDVYGTPTAQQSQSTPILSLPDDCLVHILQFLDLGDKIRFARTCQRFRAAYKIAATGSCKTIDTDQFAHMTLWDIYDFFHLTGDKVQDISCILSLKTRFNDEVLAMVAGYCRNLVSLSLHAKAIKKDIMLKMPTSIEKLDFTYCEEFDDLATILKHFSKLKELTCEVTDLQEVWLDVVRANCCPSLEVLNITTDCDADCQILAQLPKLKSVTIKSMFYDKDPSEKFIHQLVEHKAEQLERFEDNSDCTLPRRQLSLIAKLSGLRALILPFVVGMEEIVTEFEDLKNLEELTFYCSKMSHAAILDLFIACPKLSRLTAYGVAKPERELMLNIVTRVRLEQANKEMHRKLPIELGLNRDLKKIDIAFTESNNSSPRHYDLFLRLILRDYYFRVPIKRSQKMCDMYDPSNIRPDYYIDHYIEGPIAYTEDHVPVKRLRFFKVCPQMAAENTLKAFFERFGNILEWRLAKDPKNMCEHCLGSLEGRDLKNTLQHECLSGEVLYANAEDAASVLLCYPHCEEGKYFKVEPSYTWKQPDVYGTPTAQQSQSAPILSLPDDCLVHILQFLDLGDKIRFARTCQRFTAAYKIAVTGWCKTIDTDQFGHMTLWDIYDFFQLTGDKVQDISCTLIAKTMFNDEVLAMVVGYCRNLVSLSLHVKAITKDIMLKMPTSIVKLDFTYCKEFDDLATILKHFSKLKELSCKVSDLQEKAWLDIVRENYCPSLEVLNVTTGTGCQILAQLPKLKSVRIDPQFYAEDPSHKLIQQLVEHKAEQLERFEDTGDCKMPRRKLSLIAKLSELRTLILPFQEGMTKDIVKEFEDLKNLEELTFYCSKMSHADILALLIACPKLSRLTAYGLVKPERELILKIVARVRLEQANKEMHRKLPIELGLNRDLKKIEGLIVKNQVTVPEETIKIISNDEFYDLDNDSSTQKLLLFFNGRIKMNYANILAQYSRK
nr:uncharacterized protein LOC108071987 [Drosophila kikkawai]